MASRGGLRAEHNSTFRYSSLFCGWLLLGRAGLCAHGWHIPSLLNGELPPSLPLLLGVLDLVVDRIHQPVHHHCTNNTQVQVFQAWSLMQATISTLDTTNASLPTANNTVAPWVVTVRKFAVMLHPSGECVM